MSGREDAAVVYRWLSAVRLEGGSSLEEIAWQCFPVPADVDVEAAVKALRSQGVRRVLEAVVFMRSSGVRVTAVPSAVTGTRFILSG